MSTDKPRFAPVTKEEAAIMLRPESMLGCPHLYRRHDNAWWADADELRTWRDGYTSTSFPEPK